MFDDYSLAENRNLLIGVLAGSAGLLVVVAAVSILLISRRRRSSQGDSLSKQERNCIDTLNKTVQAFDEKGEPSFLSVYSRSNAIDTNR